MASLGNKVAFVQIKYTLESRKWYRDHCGGLRRHISESDCSASEHSHDPSKKKLTSEVCM